MQVLSARAGQCPGEAHGGGRTVVEVEGWREDAEGQARREAWPAAVREWGGGLPWVVWSDEGALGWAGQPAGSEAVRGHAKEVRGAGAAGMIKKSLSVGFNFVFLYYYLRTWNVRGYY